jgi:hypothetical protein
MYQHSIGAPCTILDSNSTLNSWLECRLFEAQHSAAMLLSLEDTNSSWIYFSSREIVASKYYSRKFQVLLRHHHLNFSDCWTTVLVMYHDARINTGCYCFLNVFVAKDLSTFNSIVKGIESRILSFHGANRSPQVVSSVHLTIQKNLTTDIDCL